MSKKSKPKKRQTPLREVAGIQMSFAEQTVAKLQARIDADREYYRENLINGLLDEGHQVFDAKSGRQIFDAQELP